MNDAERFLDKWWWVLGKALDVPACEDQRRALDARLELFRLIAASVGIKLKRSTDD